jgi:prepilin-type N-terminal cleavage/methylation domain-containing protein
MISTNVATPAPSQAERVRRPDGFTIVELLVVTSIMALLFGLVLAGARPSIGGELRGAAQQFASVLLAAQSRAISDPEGAAVVLEEEGVSCIAVFTGEPPPFGIGTVASGFTPAAADTTAAVTITPTNGCDLQQGYRIQFFGSDPALPASAWFGFQPPGTARFRSEDGQSAFNTVWPTPAGGQLKARVACYPAQGPLAMAFPKSVGIDFRYSGSGDDPATPWGGLAAKGDIGLSFNSVGAVDALMRGLGSTAAAARQPVEPVYFLVAARAEIDADGALASPVSLWVAIQPQTGRVTVSSNIPQSGKDRDAVRAARASARATLAAGK